MGYAFVSYSHKDQTYVRKLVAALEAEGINAWIDERIDYGGRWMKVIQENLDGCSAFLLVLTPEAYESDYVSGELSRALAKKKAIFPLLLRGDTWLAVQAFQYVDVQGEKLPPVSFYAGLKKALQDHASPGVVESTNQVRDAHKIPPPAPKKPVKKVSQNVDYDFRPTLPAFSALIDSRWQEGYDLGSVAYGDKTWFGVFPKRPPVTGYEYRLSVNELIDAINQKWKEGFDLGSVTYGDGVWFGTFPKRAPVTGYEFRSSLKDLIETINTRWKNGFDLGAVTYGNGVWFGTFPKKKPVTGYEYRASIKEFSDVIHQKWLEGFDLGTVAYGKGVWFGTFPKRAPETGYAYRANLAEFQAAIEEKSQEGYDLSAVTYGDALWFGTFVRRKN